MRPEEKPSRGLCRFWGALFILLVVMAFPAATQDRLRGVALVIGNAGYRHLPGLANPERDAVDIETALSELGFETVRRIDRDAKNLRRDLDRFIEDAADADVAVFYYAGHGIEAGGENWLVPVDADLSALGEAGDRLLPVGDVLQRLRAAVPVTILLLDACRDNPFPQGALLRRDRTAADLPVSAGGLAETRGAAKMTLEPASAQASLGMVIGFAAEPGRPALDGDGDNSPYAAALFRHLSAMPGEEFGTVMRMVAEEVYLKTGGRQRPWVNESLRRLLYFGAGTASPAGEEGQILAERRRLLVTIADLPDIERGQVERVAANGGVPMDAVYAILEALGDDAPRDASRIEEILAQQVEQLKAYFARQDVLDNTDAELSRLAALTDKAVSEGAIETARKLRASVDARISELEKTIEQAEAGIRARRIEFAAEHARTAEVHALAFRYDLAAEYYGRAADQVARWDDDRRFGYRMEQVAQLSRNGQFMGDKASLEASIEISRREVSAISQPEQRSRQARALASLGFALMTVGARDATTDRLHEAALAYARAAELFTPDSELTNRLDAQRNLAFVHMRLGERETGAENLERAAAIYRSMLPGDLRQKFPEEWASTQFHLGTVLMRLGERAGSRALLEEAAVAVRASLEMESRQKAPYDWAMAHNNLGTILWEIGEFEKDTVTLRQALAEYDLALEEIRKETMPSAWATIMGNRGAILVRIGSREDDAEAIAEAIDQFRRVLEVHTPASSPVEWATAVNNLGSALFNLGVERLDVDLMRQSVETLEEAASGTTHDSLPVHWSTMHQNIAIARVMIGYMENDEAQMEAAIDSFASALTVRTRDRVPIEWAQTMIGMGIGRATLGSWRGDPAQILEGRADVELARDVLSTRDVRGMDGAIDIALTRIDAMLAAFPQEPDLDVDDGGSVDSATPP